CSSLRAWTEGALAASQATASSKSRQRNERNMQILRENRRAETHANPQRPSGTTAIGPSRTRRAKAQGAQRQQILMLARAFAICVRFGPLAFLRFEEISWYLALFASVLLAGVLNGCCYHAAMRVRPSNALSRSHREKLPMNSASSRRRFLRASSLAV